MTFKERVGEKMKFKKFLCILAAAVMPFVFCGCNLFTVDTAELLSPPMLSGDLSSVKQVIDKTAPNGYAFEYPTSGDRRSAVVTEDIDLDGVPEAFAFYSTADGESKTVHISLIKKQKGKWKFLAEQTVTAGGVDKIEFCDLDKDGVKEIVAGFELYSSSSKQLAVYSAEEKGLINRLLKPYTTFICCDLDENGLNEIFVQNLSTTDLKNSAYLYTLTESGSTQTSCLMDGSVKTVSEPVLSELSSGKPAIYIDEIKSVGAITEVLYLKKGELTNGLLDTSGTVAENLITLRSSTLTLTDINNDGILEIPVASEIPSANDTNELLYYTNWCSFNGDTLAVKLVTVVNSVDGYYLTVPQKWVGKVAIFKDTEKRVRNFYEFDSATNAVGRKLASFKALPEKEYDEGNYSGFFELAKFDGVVFLGSAAKIEGELAIDQKTLLSMLTPYTQN